jgi:hypothetical protein
MRKIMKPEITIFKHEHVNKDGTFERELGSVHIEGHITISHPKSGCGMDGCNCSPGHWISVALPRTNKGIVRGMTIQFKNRKELEKYLQL